MLNCIYCTKECKNNNSLRNHQRLCKYNPDRQKSNIELFKAKNNIPWNKDKKGAQKAWNRGKTGTFKGKAHSPQTRAKMSASRNKLYTDGWECVAGRCKKYNYESPVAGKIKVDGSWELIFCRFADANNLKWERNKKRFPYTKPDGKAATYQPDFYVHNWKSYVEVKGYETGLDKAKWSQFPERLIIYRKKEIGELDEWLKSTVC